MSDILRTFIAFQLPENIISHIRMVQKKIRTYGFKVGWVKPENIHLTLKFLGEISKQDIDTVVQSMAETAKLYSPLTFSAKGIGVFPTVKRPRILWIGLNGDTYPLIQLQKDLEERLDSSGFPKEGRAFKAHLTLGRARAEIDPRQLVEVMEKFSGIESEQFISNKIILFRSELKSGGAVYTELHSVDLSKGGNSNV